MAFYQQSSEDDLVDLNLMHNVDVRIGAGSERRYVPLRAPSCSFQPIRSDSPNPVFPLQPVQGRFSCSPVLYGHDVHPDEFNNPMMATGRAAASQTQKSEATTKKVQTTKDCRLDKRRNGRTTAGVGPSSRIEEGFD
ncbi:unnamed protein product [Porites lobata]|uniref:Uncharacterized protein n=1 Tax=Porites lobata TaxID=104759 RepID=A0ABN8QEA6_9CNID|nr:unnamed protein product [Porites lobata]